MKALPRDRKEIEGFIKQMKDKYESSIEDRKKIINVVSDDKDKAIEEIKQQMKKILARIEKLENN